MRFCFALIIIIIIIILNRCATIESIQLKRKMSRCTSVEEQDALLFEQYIIDNVTVQEKQLYTLRIKEDDDVESIPEPIALMLKVIGWVIVICYCFACSLCKFS